jgi:hypothetical protein
MLRGLTLAVPALWTFPSVFGAVFADAAWTWNRTDLDGNVIPDYFSHRPEFHAGSAGVSFFIGGGFYPALRWDYVWRTRDFHTFSHRPLTQFSLGYNF